MLVVVDGNNLSRYKKVSGTELKNSKVRLYRWVFTQRGDVFVIVDHPEYIKTPWNLAGSKHIKFFSKIFGIDLSDVLTLDEENWILSLVQKDNQH